MKTSHIIVPRHEADGFVIEWLFKDEWNEYGSLMLTRTEAEQRAIQFAKFEGWDVSRVRVVPKREWVDAFPSQDYIEKIWLDGYQNARAGKENPYAEDFNYHGLNNRLLWNEGAEAFRLGLQLFGN